MAKIIYCMLVGGLTFLLIVLVAVTLAFALISLVTATRPYWSALFERWSDWLDEKWEL